MVSHEQSKLTHWQEVVIDAFETSVDTQAFEAVVEQQKVQDDMVVQIDELTLPQLVLPKEMTEVYTPPSRWHITKFRAHFSQSFAPKDEQGDNRQDSALLSTDEDADNSWTLNVWFNSDGQDYLFMATPEATIMNTVALNGQKLHLTFLEGFMSRFLTSIAGTQIKASPDMIQELLEREHTPDPKALLRLLETMGSASAGSAVSRDRLVWLPQLEDKRALIIKFGEMVSAAESLRKLSYRLAWKPEDLLANDVVTHRTDSMSPYFVPTVYSTRVPLDYEPRDLLDIDAIEALDGTHESKVGAFFDGDMDRSAHANVIATIKPVLDMYLQRFAYLDSQALGAILNYDQ